jgi:hypothetical protein
MQRARRPGLRPPRHRVERKVHEPGKALTSSGLLLRSPPGALSGPARAVRIALRRDRDGRRLVASVGWMRERRPLMGWVSEPVVGRRER